MIGYNVGKVDELVGAIKSSYKSIGEKMATGWPTLSQKLEEEWIGYDELHYETQLATDIVDLYGKCTDTVNVVMKNIKILLDNWKEFQKNNILTGDGVTADVAVSGSIYGEFTLPELETYDMSNVKAGEPAFLQAETLDVNMGLKNGLESATNIKGVFDTYIDDVYEGVKGLYTSISASSAFLSSTQEGGLANQIELYLEEVGKGLAKLATCHKSIYDALDALIKKYGEEEDALKADVTSTTSEASNEFAKVSEQSLGKESDSGSSSKPPMP